MLYIIRLTSSCDKFFNALSVVISFWAMTLASLPVVLKYVTKGLRISISWVTVPFPVSNSLKLLFTVISYSAAVRSLSDNTFRSNPVMSASILHKCFSQYLIQPVLEFWLMRLVINPSYGYAFKREVCLCLQFIAA